MKVLLVSAPFAPIDRPSLGLSLLKAGLRRQGVACDIAYLNLAFARLLGTESYERITRGLLSAALAGEWIFTECLYGQGHDPGETYVEDVLQRPCRPPDDDIDIVLRARALAPRFVSEALTAVPWVDYDLAGFTSVGPQNIASLALAGRVKLDYPRVLVAFGGHNWEGVMGRELHRRFPFVDVSCSGEADATFPALVERLDGGAARGLDDVSSIVYRHRGRTRATPQARPLTDLDALPVPDYGDFFAALSESDSPGPVRPVLPFEASRGCWWAARKPCLFCGINGLARTYRAKTADRIVRELRELASPRDCAAIDVVDQVVPGWFVTSVLPRLADDPLSAPLSFEARADLSRDDVDLVAAVGASIQSGVESLSDRVLRLTHKGTTSLENVRLMKWCKARGVRLAWNVLYGVPGETPEDYEETFALLPAIRFLDPPQSCGPVVLERFSPYFDHAVDYGLGHVRPNRSYRYLYPFPDAALRNIAYFFDYDHPSGPDRPGYVQRLKYEIRSWQEGPVGELRSRENAEGQLVLVDTRPSAVEHEITLDGLDCRLYEACDGISSKRRLAQIARLGSVAGQDIEEEMDRRLASFVERGLMVAVADRYLSLALPASQVTARGHAGGTRPSRAPVVP